MHRKIVLNAILAFNSLSNELTLFYIYRGDWAREERAIMEDNGYKNGDDLSGKMFPTLFEKS